MQKLAAESAALKPRKLKTLRLLVEAGERLASTLSLSKLYLVLLDVVSKAMPCDGFIVSSYNSQTREITCDFAHTGGEVLNIAGFPPIRLAESGGMQSQVIKTGVSQIYRDVSQRVAEAGNTYFEVNKDGEFKNLPANATTTSESIMVPIKLDEIVVGVVHVSREQGRDYEDEDVKLLEGLVHQLAMATQNARLYERARSEIAERKRIEEGLRAAESRLLQALNAMPAIAWSAGKDGRVIGFNDRLTEYTGDSSSIYAHANAIWSRLVHPDESARMLADYGNSLGQGTSFETEVRLKRQDGVYRWHLIRMAPIHDGEGKIDRWFGTATDVHDLKIANAALEAVLENAPDGIFRIDRNLRWLYLNPAASRLFKNPQIGPDVSIADSHLPHGVGSSLRQACTELFGGQQQTTFGFAFDLCHYTVIGVRESKREDLQSGALFICRDVTSSIESQEALTHINEELERRVSVRTEELATSIREMEGFAYSISHDFRAPLRAISATSSILLEEFGDLIGNEGHELLERQVQASSKLGNIIDELLEFSRFSRTDLQLSMIDVSKLAEEIVEEFVIGDPELKSRIFVQAGIRTCGDPSLIRLVLTNLMENAIKFSPGKELIEVGSTPEGTIFVRDLGVGFDLRYAEKIWRPFERLVTEREFPGTGIGLANVKKIVDRHKGSIWVDSAIGKGSTFFFKLPETPVEISKI